MSSWREDPRLPYLVSAILGMIAGVAAKQAVYIQTGHFPKPLAVFADVLILGMVFIIVMYVHAIRPQIPLEGIALLSAALAMWGPKGIAALLFRFKKGALSAAESAAKAILVDSVLPVRRPTVAEAVEREREEAMDPTTEAENQFGKKTPIRRLRDAIPLEDQTPADELKLIAEADRVAPDYKPPSSGTKKEGKDNGQ